MYILITSDCQLRLFLYLQLMNALTYHKPLRYRLE